VQWLLIIYEMSYFQSMPVALLIASIQKVQNNLQTREFDWDDFPATLPAMRGNIVALN